LLQGAVIATTAAVVAYFCANALIATSRFGTGFGFLGHAANFEIGEGSISFSAGDTYLRAIVVGLVNTLKVAALGCIFSTILGVTIGVAGLSRNLLLAGLVRWYIEIVRNTPLLLQLFFWAALAQALPGPRHAISFLDAVYLTNRGVFVPALQMQGWTLVSWLVLIGFAGLVASAVVAPRRIGRLLPGSSVVLLLAAAIALLIGLPLSGVTFALDIPAVAGFNIRGGASVTPEFTALLVGLTVKFSATMAEIVRAGLESVSRGQWEAARALGLHNVRIIGKVVLPQALRVATPLATSSFLDLTKDSSLAVAIGYPDVVSIINTTANTTGQSLEALMILVGVFLAINLTVSAAMNVYNRRVALRGGTVR
jgi:general L-amino acid transport system permease protein